MGMSKKFGMFASLALMGAMDPEGMSTVSDFLVEKKQKKPLSESQKKAIKIDQDKAHGLKEFSYGENKVWALNQKNADKKARKLNYI